MKYRRNKRDMEYMNNTCRLYLLANGLNPHKAYDDMIKEHLMSGKQLPYYVKGLKDFVIVSEELKRELNLLQSQKDNQKDNQAQQENDIDKLKAITKDEYKQNILPMLKVTEEKVLKMAIADLWFSIEENGFKHITQEDIRSYKRLGII